MSVGLSKYRPNSLLAKSPSIDNSTIRSGDLILAISHRVYNEIDDLILNKKVGNWSTQRPMDVDFLQHYPNFRKGRIVWI